MNPLISSQYIKYLSESIQLYVYSLDSAPNEIKIEDRVIVLFLTEYIERLEDANFLLKNKRYTSAQILLRSAYEITIYIDYLFSDPEKIEMRAKAYYFSSYQKSFQYYNHMNETTLMTQEHVKELFKKEKIAGKQYSSFNDYLNKNRSAYKACFPSEMQKMLNFSILKDSDKPVLERIDKINWYNENNKRPTFTSLVIYMQKCIKNKGYYANAFFEIYKKNSEDVHSENFEEKFRMNDKGIQVGSSWLPQTQLPYFYNEGIMFINYLLNRIDSAKIKKQLERCQCLMLKEKVNNEGGKGMINYDQLKEV